MSATGGRPLRPYQYVVLRCVPRVEREEFLNVGVVLFCDTADYLASDGVVQAERLRALDPDVRAEAVERALAGVAAVCRGEAQGGLGRRATAYGDRELAESLRTRFGLLSAPRSTVVQPGPVHGGLTDDPAAELARLVDVLVRR